MRKSIFVAVLVGGVILAGGAVTIPWAASDTQEGTNSQVVTSPVNSGTKKKGNAFVNAIKLPFKALGKLFGADGDDSKPRRLSKKDVQKFETAQAIRINDARNPVADPPAPDDTAAELFARARTMLDRGDINGAITSLSLVVSLDPQMSEAYNLLGVAYERKGYSQLAKNCFEHALRIAPDSAQTLNDFGYSLYQRGEYEGAVRKLKRAAAIAPGDQRILNNLGLAQFRLGKHKDALKSFTLADNSLNAALNMAIMFERVGQYDQAIQYYEMARQIQPASDKALQHLAELYRRTDKPEKAELMARLRLEKTTTAAINLSR